MGIRHAASADGARIAFAQIGRGGIPLVAMRPPQFSHLVNERQAGRSHHEFDEFAGGRAVIRYDPRGTGLFRAIIVEDKASL